MTGLIDSLVGVASTAVERLTGGLAGKGAIGKDAGAAGEFATLLASMTGAAPTVALATRPREFRLGLGSAEIAVTGAETGAEESAETEVPALLALAIPMQTPSLGRPVTRLSAEEIALLEALDGEAANETAGESVAGEADEEALAGELEALAAALEATEVKADPDGLDPEFRRRLDRVIERMEAEFGHRVTIVEGVRSQTRQNLLYEQGRSRPGPVVTWTRNSNHTVGRAVDVMIDGTYNNARGYERLAQIAIQEGLRTLGPRDPGHIELPRGEGAPLRIASDQPTARQGGDLPLPADFVRAIEPARPAGAPGLAQVAQVARVADVAQVAQVAELARVAEVARVADPLRPSQAPSPAGGTPQTVNPAAAVLASNTARSGSDGDGSNSGRQEGNRESTTASSAEMELLRGDPGFSRSFSSASVEEAQFTRGTDAVQRAAQILAMKEGAANAPVNHLLLRLDSPTGGEDRIRVDLRGSTVETTLNIGSSSEAENLASKVSELRQSLERHGLEADAVRIRTTQPAGAERVEGMRTVLTAAELEGARTSAGSRSGSDTSHPREQAKDPQDHLRREPGDPRQRSRREQQQEEKA